MQETVFLEPNNKMDPIIKMRRFVFNFSLYLGALTSIISLLFFDWKVAAGILIGLIMSLIGYQMIERMVITMPHNEKDGESKAKAGYVMRWGFYAFVLALFAWLGFPILAMLVGILCHKASLLMYTYKSNK